MGNDYPEASVWVVQRQTREMAFSPRDLELRRGEGVSLEPVERKLSYWVL